jgi:hypothetical protein
MTDSFLRQFTAAGSNGGFETEKSKPPQAFQVSVMPP